MRNFTVLYNRHNKFGRFNAIPERKLKYYDLTIVLQGEMVYKVNGVTYTLTDGDAIFNKPGDVQERAPQLKRCDYFSVNFTSIEDINLPAFIENAVTNEVLLLISTIDEIIQKPYLDTNDTLNVILQSIISVIENNLKQERLSEITAKIITYIKDHLSEKITLATISELTFFSPVYCDTIFKKETGKSIINYLLDERITKAKSLLIEGSLPLTKIAELSGFTDYNYFSRTFKKKTGYTPTQYKNFNLRK
ncbi:MAG: helix-turn-helix transcriptional regulator [Clostridia bacterium]|nr:helix-turn-helix transcriptional regulator [Clostridia bacterium]